MKVLYASRVTRHKVECRKVPKTKNSLVFDFTTFDFMTCDARSQLAGVMVTGSLYAEVFFETRSVALISTVNFPGRLMNNGN